MDQSKVKKINKDSLFYVSRLATVFFNYDVCLLYSTNFR
ncbi:hypothetical protein CPEBRM1_ABPJDJAI_01462 [Companilactobacillus paralimentarius]